MSTKLYIVDNIIHNAKRDTITQQQIQTANIANIKIIFSNKESILQHNNTKHTC